MVRAMSLDVWLRGEEREADCECAECYNVHRRRISDTLYERNVTHNLNRMADAAGIYQHLWRPGEIGITRAAELIAPLEAGLAALLAEPARFKEYNPSNGWGSYEGLCDFVNEYLEACRAHPGAIVSVSR